MFNKNIEQEELDKLTAEFADTVVESPDFSVCGEINEDGLPVIKIKGRVLGVQAASLVDKICHKTDELPGNILVDLSCCDFFSSVALGFIFTLAEQRKNHGGNLVIISASEQIKKMVFMMGMGGLFNFVSDINEAEELSTDS